MKPRSALLAAAAASALLSSALLGNAAYAQAKEQFFPVLVYRTGALRPMACPGPMASWTTSS